MAVAVTTAVLLAQGQRATTERSVDTTSATTIALSENQSDADLVETYGDAVWRVEVEGCGGSGTGTAFAVDQHHLVTNAHVVGTDPSPTLRSRSGEVVGGRVIGLSSTPDVAVIEVDANLAPTLEWAPTDDLGEGQHILTLGYPLPATDFSATPGSIVSFQTSGGVREAIRTDAAVDRGNSGGPALTEDGRVAGVVTLVLLNPDGIQFVPILFTPDALRAQIDRFIDSPAAPEPDCSWVEDDLPPVPDWYDDVPIPEVQLPPRETSPAPTTTAPLPCPTGAPTATVTEFSAVAFDPDYTSGFYDVVVRGTITNTASATISLWGVEVDVVSTGTSAYGITDALALRPGEATSFEATAFVESASPPQQGSVTIEWDWDSFEHYGCGTS